MATYSEKLQDPRWQKKRLQILKRDKFKCKLCNDKETTLHIHHLKYSTQNIWDELNENLQTLCKECHLISEYYKDGFEVIRLKKYYCCYGKLFIVQCSNEKIYFEILTKENEIIEFATFDESLIQSLKKYFK